MSKECKKARNVVISTALVLMAIIIAMSMSSCASGGYYTQNEAINPLSKQYSCKR